MSRQSRQLAAAAARGKELLSAAGGGAAGTAQARAAGLQRRCHPPWPGTAVPSRVTGSAAQTRSRPQETGRATGARSLNLA